MIHASGKALIKHEKTGQIYEIENDRLDFEVVGKNERNMGPETKYSAVLHHPELGQLVWSLWEYPAGAENNRETDIGSHELLENINFGLESDTLVDNAERQARIDSLVEWFYEHYEDPVHRLPYISREGGYQWIYGGPYDAREVLEDSFPEESEEIIEAAVEEIEAEGLEWAPVSKPEDYDQAESESVNDLQAIITELKAVIADIPSPQAFPTFSFGEDGLLHLSSPPDIRAIASGDVLLEELAAVTNDLRQALVGTNIHTSLLNTVEQYNQAFSEEQISISRLYARGIKLDNAASTTQRKIQLDDSPPLSSDVEHNLNSTLELHRAYIMSHEEGRRLVDAALAYRLSPEQTKRLRAAGEKFRNSVANNPDLFGEDVKELTDDVVEDIGQGKHPERSNQVAVTTLLNLISGVLRAIGKGIEAAIILITGNAVITSLPGTTAVAIGADTINAAWHFLSASVPLLKVIAASAACDTSWVRPFSHLVARLKNLQNYDG